MKVFFLSGPGSAACQGGGSREERDLFAGGPPFGRSEKAATSILQPTRGLAAIVMAAGWLAPCLMAGLQSLISGDASLHDFFTDYGVLARSLVAAPLLILGQEREGARLAGIVRRLRQAGVVRTADLGRFHGIVRSTSRLRDSVLVRTAIALAAFAMMEAFWAAPGPSQPSWYRTITGTASLAGWWHQFVSLPILMLLLLGWLWRLGLWTRFLWQVSRLDLRLIPSHPDGAGGLKFLGLSLHALVLPAFASSAILAGAVANRVIHGGTQIMSASAPVLVFLALLLMLLAGPLLFFCDKLLETKSRGILEYGAAARDVGLKLESRWLGKPMVPDAPGANDFSAATDLYAIVGNVYRMNFLPLTLGNFAAVVVAILAPFIPVALFAASPLAVIRTLAGLLLRA